MPGPWWGSGMDSWILERNGLGNQWAVALRRMWAGVLGSRESKDFRNGFLGFERKWGWRSVSWRGTGAVGGPATQVSWDVPDCLCQLLGFLGPGEEQFGLGVGSPRGSYSP